MRRTVYLMSPAITTSRNPAVSADQGTAFYVPRLPPRRKAMIVAVRSIPPMWTLNTLSNTHTLAPTTPEKSD